MGERYEYHGASFVIVEADEKTTVYVYTTMQAFRLDVINSNGWVTFRRIVCRIRSGEIHDFNGLFGSCGKSVQLQPMRQHRFITVEV